ncbi:hypothetical protein CCP3SC15_450015 [Gammaproteobacteria bacterium]
MGISNGKVPAARNGRAVPNSVGVIADGVEICNIERAVMFGAGEQVGKAIGVVAFVGMAATPHFVKDGLTCGSIPKGRMLTGLGFGLAGEGFLLTGAGVVVGAAVAKTDFTGIKGVAEQVAQGEIAPGGMTTGGGDALFFEPGANLGAGLAREIEVFDLDNNGSMDGIEKQGDGFGIAGGEIEPVAVGDAPGRVEAFGNAASDTGAEAFGHGVDFGAAGEGGEGLNEGGGAGDFPVEFSGGDGFNGLGEGVDLDTVGGEGAGNGVDEFTQAGEVVDEKQIKFAALGSIEQIM